MSDDAIAVTSVPQVYAHLRDHPCPCGGAWSVAHRDSKRDPDAEHVMVDRLTVRCEACGAEALRVFRVDTSRPEYMDESVDELLDQASSMAALAMLLEAFAGKGEGGAARAKKKPAAKKRKPVATKKPAAKKKTKKPAAKKKTKKPAAKKKTRKPAAKKKASRR